MQCIPKTSVTLNCCHLLLYAATPAHMYAGQNGQISLILEIFCLETLFWKNIVIYHLLWYLSLVSSSTIFFNPTWPDDMESLIKKNKK